MSCSTRKNCTNDKVSQPCHKENTTWKTAAAASLHCLIGCSIGEILGLIIGVSLGMSTLGIIILDTTLAYISGFTLGLIPVMRDQKVSFIKALKIIWLGELISIAVMEFAMNFSDYHMGGMNAANIFESKFWLGILVALPVGFLAAWPVNYLLLKRHIKQKCH